MGEDGGAAALFSGMKFFVSATVPFREWFKKLICENGGRLENLEKNANVLLADYRKRGRVPAQSVSYQFVENSIRNKRLEDVEKYRISSKPDYASSRPVGSVQIPPQIHRKPFDIRDDKLLYDFVKPIEEEGGPISGNMIYQQFAEKHPHHTFQAWRHRYLHKVRHYPRPVAPENVKKTSSASHAEDKSVQSPVFDYADPFDNPDKNELLKEAKYVLECDSDHIRDAWEEWTKHHSEYTADEWMKIFDDEILPVYLSRKAKNAGERETPDSKDKRDSVSVSVSDRMSIDPVSEPSKRQPPTHKRRADLSPRESYCTQGMRPHKIPRVEAPLTVSDRVPRHKQLPKQQTPCSNKDGGKAHSEASVHSRVPRDRPPHTDDERADLETIDRWLDSRLRRYHTNLETLVEALKCTTMNLRLADAVVCELARGRPLPADMRGVWTETDDRIIQCRDCDAIERVRQKHGRDSLYSRGLFLLKQQVEKADDSTVANPYGGEAGWVDDLV